MRLALTAVLCVPCLTAPAQSDTAAPHHMDSVVVTGVRLATDMRRMPASVTVVGRDKLDDGSRTSLLPTLSEQAPGFFATSRGVMGYGVSDGAAGVITMRGLSAASGQAMVLVDGSPQYQGLFGHATPDAYLSALADRVEVLRGPASAVYGSNAMGGVVNIITRQPREDEARADISLGAGSYGTIVAEASGTVSRGRFSSALAAQYGKSDNHRPSMDFYQYGGMAKLAYRANNHWKAYADLSVTHFAASCPGETDAPLIDARQWVNRGAAQMAVENGYTRSSGAVRAYYNFGRHRINDGHAPDADPKTYLFISHDALAGVSLHQTLTLMPGNRITLGLDHQQIYGRAGNRDMQTHETTRTMGNEGNEHEHETAAYIDMSQDLTARLNASAALRLDGHSRTGKEWIPQGSLSYAARHADGTLRATVAKGFRNPSLRELYLWGTANPSLRPERTVSAELAWRQSLSHTRLTYALCAFLIRGSNAIQTAMVDGKSRYLNTGPIRNEGVEAELTYHANDHWRADANYSYNHMRRPTAGAPEHKAHLGAAYTTGPFALSASMLYVHRLHISASDYSLTQSFPLLHATATLRIARGVCVWISGDNLLARRYETADGYPMPRATVMAGIRVSIR